MNETLVHDTTVWPDCPQSLSPEQIARFHEMGYLAFENVLSPAEVAQARADISTLIGDFAFNPERATWEKPSTDRTDSNYAGWMFQSRTSRFGIWLQGGCEPSPDAPDEIEPMVRKLMWFERETPLFEQLAFTHPRLHGVLGSLLGEGYKLFQTMGLIKPAHIGTEKPWHQDNAYFSVTPLDAIVGVWIALDDAAADNGCMHVLEGGHKLGALRHHHTFDCEILPGRIDAAQARPIELKAGGALFFYGMLPHQTPPNRSDKRRRALQYHYHRADASAVPTQEYNRIFAEADGTPASCRAAR